MKYTRPLTKLERRIQQVNAWLYKNGWFWLWLGTVFVYAWGMR